MSPEEQILALQSKLQLSENRVASRLIVINALKGKLNDLWRGKDQWEAIDLSRRAEIERLVTALAESQEALEETREQLVAREEDSDKLQKSMHRVARNSDNAWESNDLLVIKNLRMGRNLINAQRSIERRKRANKRLRERLKSLTGAAISVLALGCGAIDSKYAKPMEPLSSDQEIEYQRYTFRDGWEIVYRIRIPGGDGVPKLDCVTTSAAHPAIWCREAE